MPNSRITARNQGPLRLGRAGVAALVSLALLLPGCGSSTPTITGVPRAAITLTVDPNPIPPSQNTLTGTVTIGYKVTITETAGLGGQIQFVSGQVYDPVSGALVSLTYFDSNDLIVFVGKDRIEPSGTLVVPQTASYLFADLSTKATLTVNVQMKDDRDNLINQSLLVPVE
jgi:hypothetical protein